VRQAIERNMPLAKEKSIEIKDNLSEIIVKGNPQSLVELVSILLNNAIKYGPKKSEVQINARKEKRRSTPLSRRVIIEVIDQGMGIDEKDIPHIFDRFYRVDASRSKAKVDGYGLGLSIAKSIVDMHKGEIKVETEIGKGSTFIINLPV